MVARRSYDGKLRPGKTAALGNLAGVDIKLVRTGKAGPNISIPDDQIIGAVEGHGQGIVTGGRVLADCEGIGRQRAGRTDEAPERVVPLRGTWSLILPGDEIIAAIECDPGLRVAGRADFVGGGGDGSGGGNQIREKVAR